MNSLKKNILFPCSLVLLVVMAMGCTKLDQTLKSTLTKDQTSSAIGSDLLLQNAYYDVGGPYSDPGNIMALEEVTADECVVPTRGGDWDDNGKWRKLKQHKFSPDNVDVILSQFDALNKLNFDATNVLAFTSSKSEAAEARFLRALSLYQLLDLFGQFPVRQPNENLLNAPKVYSGEEAVQFIITELKAVIPDLPASNNMSKANVDAANVLLMKTYLNHGAFINRSAPTFSDADMQNVITIGNTIINSAKYSFSNNYFDNFNAQNSSSKEGIFAYPNTSGIAANNSGIQNRWWATLHYNSYSKQAQQSGWNGFSTVAEFYNSFGVTSAPVQNPNDTLLDGRIGGRFYPGCTDISGIRPGLLIGQQYNENKVALNDRHGHLLSYDPNLSPDLKETGDNKEIVGIRVVKYVPDFSNGGKNYGGGTSGNWVMILRYPDVVLMVAEAKMRAANPDNAGALVLVNTLRSARGAGPMLTLSLVNTNNVYDPGTLLAERGRELYWELVRRTDLIRFGVFMKPWALKAASDAAHLVFPIPSASLAANPNLKQNPGY